jgi:hypothetical protein
MSDLLYLGLTVVALVLTLGMIALFDRLMEKAP